MQFRATQTKILQTLTSSIPHYTNTRAAEQKCLSLLESATSLSNLTQIHAQILKLGLQNNPLVLIKFTSTSSNLRVTDYASSFLFSPESDTRLYDSFLFNTIIRAYAQTGSSKFKALSMYKLMLRFGVYPNKFTFPFVLKACSGIGDLKLGMSVHGFVLKLGFDDDVHVRNTMVHMYCCNVEGVEFARKVFDEMPNLDSVSWSAMIGGLARLGMGRDSVELFRKMQVENVCPDEITMVSMLSACSDIGALELGKWVESYVEKGKIYRTVELSNALIDMFAKCGDVDKAINLFRNMNQKDIVSWTSVIVGLAMHGRGLEAVSFFEEMVENGVHPDGVSFIGLLSACSHSGLVNKGKNYFELMRTHFGVVPKIEHYGCMVDMLCRAGLINKAFEFVQQMPMEPNPIILRTLTNACRTNGEFKLGESISKQLITAEPMQESNYVLLSNIYAKTSKWENKMEIREVMDKKG
ncbi:Pentatricopeptide repeat (PPR) superfamily protein [Euphorbia peplus]|nr:Pentatricopeptide repeat (PPR) superfamily protein [Euphorbia peplus]